MYTQIVKFTVKPEHLEAFKAELRANQTGAALEPGLVEMRLFEEKTDPNSIWAYERFQDKAAVEYHLAQAHTKKLLTLAKTALAAAPEVMSLGETTPAPDHSKQAKPEDDVFVIFFVFKIKDGYRERLIQQFETHITHTRQEEEGNILFDLYTVDGADDTLAVYEHWRKESDVWDIHFKQPYAEVTGALMHEAVVGELEQYMHFVTEIN